jgi:hypothetical protein
MKKILNKILDKILGKIKTPKYKVGDKVIFKVGCLSYISGTSECAGHILSVEATRQYVYYWCESPQMTTGYNKELMPVGIHEDNVRLLIN